MTHGSTLLAIAVLSGALAAASPGSAAAQQAASGAQPSAVAGRAGRAGAQGFSVVLVVGDLQGAGGEEEVPPAARRALADMKDFLPYKSFKLVDAAWIMGSTHLVSRLRGPEDRDYELEISVTEPRQAQPTAGGASSTAGDSRIGVTFTLRDAGPSRESSTAPASGSGAAASSPAGENPALAALLTELEALRARQREARARYNGSHPEVVRLEREVRSVQAKVEAVEHGSEQRRAGVARVVGRPLMNTSFSMDIGETVVVGTSRLIGNSKALIALLTAVPPKSPPR